MTKDEFDERYELLERVTEGDVETHHALHPSGAVVMVHFVGGTGDFQKQVLDAVGRLDTEGPKGRVLYVHDLEGLPVVVTRFAMDFVSLESWLAAQGVPLKMGGGRATPDREASGNGQEDVTRRIVKNPATPPASNPADAGSAGGPGEFTQIFQAASSDDFTRLDAEPPKHVELSPDPNPWVDPAERPPPAAPPEDAPGEFTRMFQAVGGADAPEKPEVEPEKPSASAEDVNPWTDPARRPGSTRPRTGEFTRLFEQRLGAEGPPPSTPAPQTPPAWSTPPEKAQSLPEKAQSPPPPGPPRPAPDDSWSDALRRPGRKDDPLSSPLPPAAPPASPATGGEFTMIFGGDERPSTPTGATPPHPTEVQKTVSVDGGSGPSAPAQGPPKPSLPKISGPTPRLPTAPIRGTLPPRPQAPRIPPAPRVNQVAGVLAGLSTAAPAAADPQPAAGAASAEENRDHGSGKDSKGPSPKLLGIGLAAVLILSVGLILFFAFWDFSPAAPAAPAAGEATVEEPTVEAPTESPIG